MVELNGQSYEVIALHIACIVVSTVAVALRFAVRFSKRQRFGWDDGSMVVAWAMLQIYLSLVIKITYMGSTVMMTAVIPPQDLLKIFKLSYALALVFETVNIAVKVSILCFYCRIFTVEVFKRQAYIVGGFSAAWFIASVLVTAFQCTPVRKAWYRELPGSCVNIDAFVLGYETSNALIDITLIILPMRMIQTLKLDGRQKILLSSIFALGGFVCIASILRMVYLYHPSDPMHIYVNGPIWSAISVAAAVLCANLPTLKPVLQISIILTSIRGWYSSMKSTTNISKATDSSRRRDYNEINEDFPPTIGGTRERRNERKGQQEVHPLHTFNTTVGATAMDGTVDERPP